LPWLVSSKLPISTLMSTTGLKSMTLPPTVTSLIFDASPRSVHGCKLSTPQMLIDWIGAAQAPAWLESFWAQSQTAVANIAVEADSVQCHVPITTAPGSSPSNSSCLLILFHNAPKAAKKVVRAFFSQTTVGWYMVPPSNEYLFIRVHDWVFRQRSLFRPGRVNCQHMISRGCARMQMQR